MGNVFSPRLLGEWAMSVSRVDPGMAVGDTMAPTITDKPPTPGYVGREFRAFTPLLKGTEPAEAQNQHKSKVKVSFPHRPTHCTGRGSLKSPDPAALSFLPPKPCPQPMTMGGSDYEVLEPPVPAMPRGGSTAPTELQQRDISVVTLLLTVGVGRMLLKCLFLLRRAILYCRERGMVAAPAWTSWLCQEVSHGSWSQPGFTQ